MGDGVTNSKGVKGYKTFRLRFSKRLYIASFICIYIKYIYVLVGSVEAIGGMRNGTRS